MLIWLESLPKNGRLSVIGKKREKKCCWAVSSQALRDIPKSGGEGDYDFLGPSWKEKGLKKVCKHTTLK